MGVFELGTKSLKITCLMHHSGKVQVHSLIHIKLVKKSYFFSLSSDISLVQILSVPLESGTHLSTLSFDFYISASFSWCLRRLKSSLMKRERTNAISAQINRIPITLLERHLLISSSASWPSSWSRLPA